MDIIVREDKKGLSERQKRKKKNQVALLTLSEAKAYIARTIKTYRRIGFGVWLILMGVSTVVAFGNIGIFFMFTAIAMAVMMFISSGNQKNEFEQIEGMAIRLDEEAYQIIEQEKHALKPRNSFRIALGVALILVAVGGIAGLGLNPGFLLFTIGFSVFLFITSGTLIGTYDHLLSQGDYIKHHSYPLIESQDKMLEQRTIVRQIQVDTQFPEENNPSVMENISSAVDVVSPAVNVVSSAVGAVSSAVDAVSSAVSAASLDVDATSHTAKVIPPTNEDDLTTIKKDGNTFISQLYTAKNIITNPKTLSDIDEIIDLTNKIIYRLEKEPDLIPSTMRLFDYYLPTTVKLVVNYSEVKKQGISGTNIDSMINSIEEALSNLTIAYRTQLEKLYLHTSVDLEAEIATLEAVLRKEGLLSDGMIDFSGQSPKNV
jgi:hypothetical protein